MELNEYITATIICGIVSLGIYLWRKSNKNLPPGPLGLPIAGYYPFLSSKPHLDLGKLAQQYGDVLSFRTVGGKLIVVLSGSRTWREVFVSRAEEFIGRPLETHVLDWFSDGLGVIQEEGDAWKEQRQFFLRAVKQFGFGKLELEPRIHEEIHILLKELRRTNGQQTNLLVHLSHTTHAIICPILFNKRFDKNDPVFIEISQGLLDMLCMFVNSRILLVGWFFRYVIMNFGSLAKRARNAKRKLKPILDEIVENHIRNFDPENVKDYVDTFLLQRYELRKNGLEEMSTFSVDRLKAITMNMMMEATYSVSETLSALLVELSHHPDAQKHAQQEMDGVVGHERLPSLTDKPELPYVEALILELFRTAMHFNTSTLYSNFDETSLHGYRIPKRSILISNLWSVNHDPQIFPNPTKFDPRRFLDSDGNRIKTDGPYPYGYGKRACIGEALAQMEIFLIISSVLLHFTILRGEKGSNTVKLIDRQRLR